MMQSGDQANSDGRAEVSQTHSSGVAMALVSTGGVGALASAVVFVGWGVRLGSGVLVGALIAVANLWVFHRVVTGFLSGHKARGFWGIVGVLKFVGLLVFVAMLLQYHVVAAIPLAVGYGALPIGIALSGVFSGIFGAQELDVPVQDSEYGGTECGMSERGIAKPGIVVSEVATASMEPARDSIDVGALRS
ncbi:MAG: ATP synthase subunit I [Polyangiaceae bacterium]|nr:ATP synthase subunit I [Polyangiaceae bacterium]